MINIEQNMQFDDVKNVVDLGRIGSISATILLNAVN